MHARGGPGRRERGRVPGPRGPHGLGNAPATETDDLKQVHGGTREVFNGGKVTKDALSVPVGLSVCGRGSTPYLGGPSLLPDQGQGSSSP